MAKQAEEKQPWYGKTCARCDAPLNYAQAAKGVLPGYCGRCTDAVRRMFQEEVERKDPSLRILVRERTVVERGLGVLLWLIVGLLLGVGGSLALAAFDRPRFDFWVEKVYRAAGR